MDKKTGFRDAGFGLDIVDWIMEPGSDEAYQEKLNKELIYRFNTPYHGKTPKRLLHRMHPGSIQTLVIAIDVSPFS